MRRILIPFLSFGTNEWASYFLARFLRALGFIVDVRLWDAGTMTKAWANANYDAIIWIEYRRASQTVTGGDSFYNTFTSFAAGDKPVFFIGGQVRGTPPADFPIIAFNEADTSTYFQWDAANTYTASNNNRVGSCITDRRGRSLWCAAANYLFPESPTAYATYRVDMARIDANRTIEWVLDASRMQITAPDNHALVVRYFNRYFLPMMAAPVYPSRLVELQGIYNRISGGVLLLLWALTREGFQPNTRVPLVMEIDHALDTVSTLKSASEQARIVNASLRWLADFGTQKGFITLIGIYTGFPPISGSHEGSLQQDATSPWAHEAHQFLLQTEGKAFALCYHDHTTHYGDAGVSMTRHSGGVWGAPRNITHPDAPFGTGTTATVNLRSEEACHIWHERNIFDMRRLGFQFHNAPPLYAVNCGRNAIGHPQMLDLWLFYGFRNIRAAITSSMIAPGTTDYTNYAWGKSIDVLRYKDLEIYSGDDIHHFAYRGIYSPGGTFPDNDLNTQYSLGASDALTAYRRYKASRLLNMIAYALFGAGVGYIHSYACYGANPLNPLPSWEESAGANWNGWIEAWLGLDEYVRAFPEWLQWGDHRHLREHRNMRRRNLGIG